MHVRGVARTQNWPARIRAANFRKEDRRTAVLDFSIDLLDEKQSGSWVTVWKRESHEVTDGVSCGSTRKILLERSRILYRYRGTYSFHPSASGTWKYCLGSNRFGGLLLKWSQTVRVTESKCLQPAFNRAGLPERGLVEDLPGSKTGRVRNK